MNESTPRAFAEIEIGDEIGPVVRVPSLEVVQRYAAATGLTDRRFIDPDAQFKFVPGKGYRPHEGELACVKDPEPLSPALPCAGSTRPFGYWYRGIVCPTGRSITPSISSVLPPSLAFVSEERLLPIRILF